MVKPVACATSNVQSESAEGQQTAIVRAKGREISARSLQVGSNNLVIAGSMLKMLRLQDEWFQEVGDTGNLVQRVLELPPPADVFTFIEHPSRNPQAHGWHVETDNVAAIPLMDYQSWWDKQIDKQVRKKVRKAEKKGVYIVSSPLDERLLRGIEEIYDETPVRQGKPFWHYKKGIDYLRRVHETFPDRSEFLCAYRESELLGFVKLVYSGEFASTLHVIAKLGHRDSAVTNALVAKAVETSCEKGMRYLVYDKYDYEVGGSASLLQFKHSNGFRKLEFPRYYVPLSAWGRAAIRLNLHRGLAPILPKRLVEMILDGRQRWYRFRYRDVLPDPSSSEA